MKSPNLTRAQRIDKILFSLDLARYQLKRASINLAYVGASEKSIAAVLSARTAIEEEMNLFAAELSKTDAARAEVRRVNKKLSDQEENQRRTAARREQRKLDAERLKQFACVVCEDTGKRKTAHRYCTCAAGIERLKQDKEKLLGVTS